MNWLVTHRQTHASGDLSKYLENHKLIEDSSICGYLWSTSMHKAQIMCAAKYKQTFWVVLCHSDHVEVAVEGQNSIQLRSKQSLGYSIR